MGTSFVLIVVKILSAFLLLALACAGLVKITEGKRGQSPGQGLRITGHLSLGRNRFLCVVKEGEERFLLGVTDHTITLLKELAGKDDEVSFTGQGSSKEFLSCLKEGLEKTKDRLLKKENALAILCILSLLGCSGTAYAAPSLPVPEINVRFDGVEGEGPLGTALGILALLTVLALAPAILILTTSFTRIVVVFSFLRSGMGTQQTPPNQVIIGLSLLLTFFVMMPTFKNVNEMALTPYLAGEMTGEEAFELAGDYMKGFMLRQTREKDLSLFADPDEEVRSPEDLKLFQVVPAFVLSELKTAFQMGFTLYLPFLVVDMVVASTLMAMGMMMLPPVLISLPFKILLFVLVDGWTLVTGSLVGSFR